VTGQTVQNLKCATDLRRLDSWVAAASNASGLTPLGPDTRLKVIHSDLERDSKMEHGIDVGWPAVLSNLKTLLELGRTRNASSTSLF